MTEYFDILDLIKIWYLGLSRMVNCNSGNGFRKFNMADPLCRTDYLISLTIVETCYLWVCGMLDHKTVIGLCKFGQVWNKILLYLVYI